MILQQSLWILLAKEPLEIPLPTPVDSIHATRKVAATKHSFPKYHEAQKFKQSSSNEFHISTQPNKKQCERIHGPEQLRRTEWISAEWRSYSRHACSEPVLGSKRKPRPAQRNNVVSHEHRGERYELPVFL